MSAALVLNILAMFIIGFNISKLFYDQESNYLAEISDNMNSTIEKTFTEFTAITTVLAQNDTIIQMLIECDKANPMHENENADIVIEQMNKIAKEFQDQIYFVGIFDVDQYGYLMHDGDFSDDSFSFKEWDYYEPVLTCEACITEPYLDTEIDEMVVSVCYPVFSNISILTDTIDNISNSVNENVKNIEYVNKQSKQATNELSQSNQKMNEMVVAMKNIETSSNAIQNIIKVIEDVAFQTDILALNASVEASRAGQAGKDFAIVADEVRSLASRTSEAVEETVRLVEESMSAVTVGSQLVEETSSSLNKAIEVVDGYIGTLETVTDTSRGQAQSISEINTSVHEITTVTQNNSSISEESAAASEELSSQATIMRDSIGKFKLNP